MQSAPVLFELHGRVLHVVLNRVRQLNALDHDMVAALGTATAFWRGGGGGSGSGSFSGSGSGIAAAAAASPPPPGAFAALVLRGAGGRAFCAGGDIKRVHGQRAQPRLQEAFFRDEYKVDLALARHARRVPHVALWDGPAMGGGLGVSHAAGVRICTERTLVAMPETAIGFAPDVGGSFFLPRLAAGPEFGLFLALSGYRLMGADALHVGAATHFLPSAALPELLVGLSKADFGGGRDAHDVVRRVVDAHMAAMPPPPPFSFSARDLADVRACFAVDRSAADILVACEALQSSSTSPLAGIGGTMRRMSPLSIVATREQMRRGAALCKLEDCLTMELRVALRLLQRDDFYEGVRAVLIDKDQRPRWSHARVEDVPAEEVATFFEPLERDFDGSE